MNRRLHNCMESFFSLSLGVCIRLFFSSQTASGPTTGNHKEGRQARFVGCSGCNCSYTTAIVGGGGGPFLLSVPLLLPTVPDCLFVVPHLLMAVFLLQVSS